MRSGIRCCRTDSEARGTPRGYRLGQLYVFTRLGRRLSRISVVGRSGLLVVEGDHRLRSANSQFGRVGLHDSFDIFLSDAHLIAYSGGPMIAFIIFTYSCHAVRSFASVRNPLEVMQ